MKYNIFLVCGLLSFIYAPVTLSEENSQIEKNQTNRTDTASLKDKENAALPEPLSLEYALGLADEKSQTSLIKAQSDIDDLEAQEALINATNGFQVGLDINLLKVKASNLLADTKHNRTTPHNISLSANKLLYDFGRSELDASIIQNKQQSSLDNLILHRDKNYLLILHDYFNVLIADLTYAYKNEELAMAYIRYDRAKTSFEQKKISELDLLVLENENLKVSNDFFESSNNQRLTRSKLAQSLNRSGQLPSDVLIPELEKMPALSPQRKLQDIQVLISAAKKNNLQIKQLESTVETENLVLKRQGLLNYPKLTGKFASAWYARDTSSADKLQIGVNLNIPLYQGGSLSAKKLQSLAKLKKLQAQVSEERDRIEQQVLEVAMKIQHLQRKTKQLDTALKYRELYLDKSRIEYDHEFKSDLGDAMVNLSLAQLNYHQNRFQLAYQWALLDSLVQSKKVNE